MEDIVDALINAPETQLDSNVRDMIRGWSSAPTSLEILQTLDECVRYCSSTDFVVMVLEQLLSLAIKNENTTYDQVVAKVTWRN